MLQCRLKLFATLLVSGLCLLLSACALQSNAHLQAQDKQVAINGPYTYRCNDNAADKIVVTFYASNPPSLIAERGDSVVRMTFQPSASGSKYQGSNKSFWEHHGEATVVWGDVSMVCRKAP